MMKTGCLLAGGVLLACAGLADDGWPLLTLRLDGSCVRNSERVRELIEVTAAHPGGMDAIWFCGADGGKTMEAVDAAVKVMAPLRDLCEKSGIECSYQQGWTLGHYTTPYKPPKNRDVQVRSDDSYARDRHGAKLSCYCPRSPDVLAYQEELTRHLVAGLRPRAIWLDDDCRLDKAGGWVCFCDRCVAAFNREEGTGFTREELTRRLFDSEGEEEVRSKWVNFNARSLALFGAATRRGANRANPSVRLCLQNGAFDSCYTGFDDRPILWELSDLGRVRTAVRTGSGWYCDEIPRMLTLKLLGVMTETERLKGYGAWIGSRTYENETCPRIVLQKSADAVVIEDTLAFAAGCNAISMYWWTGNRDEPLSYYAELLDALKERRPYFRRLADLADRTHAGGVAFERPADFCNRRLGGEQYEDGRRAFRYGNNWTNYWLMISGVPLVPSEARAAARFTQGDVARLLHLAKNDGPTTAQLEAFRDRLDELSGGKVPVRPAKTHRLVVLPRVGEQGELHAVTVWNVSIGAMRGMPLRLRRPAAPKFVWTRGGEPDRPLAAERGKLPDEWVVTLPDLNGYGVGTLFCE